VARRRGARARVLAGGRRTVTVFAVAGLLLSGAGVSAMAASRPSAGRAPVAALTHLHARLTPRRLTTNPDRVASKAVASARSTAPKHARPHFASVRSIRPATARALRVTPAVAAADALPTELGTITFSEFPDGSSITTQYEPNGIIFGGDTPFITDDGANPTSPVLSGTPQFYGSITGTFVTPDGSARTVGSFSLDVGYIDTPGSTEVVAYDSGGDVLDTEVIDDTGIVNVLISEPGIASFEVESVDPNNPDPDGWAIDNVQFEGYAFLTGPPTTGEQGGAGNETEHATTCPAGDPVNCATGSLLQQYTDFSVPGRGISLDLTRTYDSAAAASDGPFGYGWTDSYAMSLSTDSSGDVTITQEDGSTVFFQPDGSGGFVAPTRVLATLVQNPDGSYTFTRDSTEDQYNFNASGQLTSEVDRNGYTTTLTYSGGQLTAVTDPAGRKLTFTYSGSNIATVTDPMGRTWSYSYDGSGDLAAATDPLGRTWSFGYDAGHLLTSVTDPRGGVTSFTYNGSGQVAAQTDADSNTTTWSYSGDPTSQTGGVTTMTDPDSDVTTYDYAEMELQSVTHGAGTADAATTSYTYDPATLGITSITDPDGNVTTSSYDADGNLLYSTDPLGNTTYYEYNSLNEVLYKTSPLGETTQYSYDDVGNLLSVTDPLGNVTTYAYAGQPGDITSVTDPDGNVTSYTYDADGNIASMSVSPSSGVSDTTSYAYDADAERTCEASPDATAAGVTCPAAGSPAVADTTATTYNADGEVTSVTDPDGDVTSYAYDGDGEQVQVTNAAGQVTSYAFNGDNEETTVTKPGGSTTTSSYDGDGNLISQVSAVGGTTTYSYNVLNQLTSVVNPLGRTTSYTYDGDGNRLTLTDASGRTTSYTYDGDGNLTSISYSDGITPDVSYSYDGDGQRTSMTDGSGTTSYGYDGDDRLVSVTDGAGDTVSYEYDDAGLLTALTYPDGETVSRAYDGAGELTSVEDWLGNTTTFGYDASGNITSESYPNGVAARLTYDHDGNELSATDSGPSGNLASFSYSRDDLGRITAAAATGAVPGTQDYSYTQLSQLAADGSGQYGYDAAGDLTSLPGGVSQTFNAGGELTSVKSPGGTVTAPVTDAVVSANDTSKKASVVSPALTTKHASELVLAFISANGSGSKSQRVTKVSGGGLTWKLAVRSNSQHGTAEVWQASATKLIKSAKITATLADSGYNGSITVATFTGAQATIGAHAVASAARGAAAVSLKTTSADSLVWATGEDARHAAANKAVSGQVIVHQYLDTSGKSTSWVQRGSAVSAAGTTVKIADSAPTGDQWELAAVEITAAAASGGKTTYSYDPEGDRTGVTAAGQAGVSLSYDQAGRLTSYGAAATYGYDGDGLRMSKTVGGTTTTFAWDQSGAVPLLLDAGSTSYIYGPNGQPIEQISGSTPTYLLSDQQGSTRLLTNAAGAVVGTYSYSSYGAVTGHTGTATTALQYDGQYTDAESGYQYLQARYYDPATGQFISADPAAPISLSAYGYASDNPVNESDPLGLFSWSHALGITTDVLGVVGLTAGIVAAVAVSAPVIAVATGVAIIAGGVAAGIGLAESAGTCNSSGWGSTKCGDSVLQANLNTLYSAASTFIPSFGKAIDVGVQFLGYYGGILVNQVTGQLLGLDC